MLSARRRPAIRKVRERPASATLPQPPRLCSLPRLVREQTRTEPTIDPWSALVEEDIATLVPKNSEIRALFDDVAEGLEEQEETVQYLRGAANDHRLDDGDDRDADALALDALVALYAKRAEDLARRQAQTRAIAEQAAQHVPTERRRTRQRKRAARTARIAELVRQHFYTVVFSLICIWGTLQLVLGP